MWTTIAVGAWLAVGASPADRLGLDAFETAMVEHVLAGGCPHNKKPDPTILIGLLTIEKAAKLPPAARGLLIAAACRESGLRADPGFGDGGRSAGMFQFASWAKKRIRPYRTPGHRGDVRLDWRASARFWVRHVVAQYGRVSKYCKGYRGYRSKRAMRWASANVTAVRSPACKRRRPDGRCVAWVPRCSKRGTGAETLHWRTRAEWSGLIRDALSRAKTMDSQPPMEPDV